MAAAAAATAPVGGAASAPTYASTMTVTGKGPLAKYETVEVDGGHLPPMGYTAPLRRTGKPHHGQMLITVYLESIYTSTSSEWMFDDTGEFYLKLNGSRWPDYGEVLLQKDETWQPPQPVVVFSGFHMTKKGKDFNLKLSCHESDKIWDDKLMNIKIALDASKPGVKKQTLDEKSSPITLKIIVRVEERLSPKDTKMLPKTLAKREESRRTLAISTAGHTVVGLTQQMLAFIQQKNFAAYRNMLDPSLTCFEPEARGNLVEGVDFHKFYFDLGDSYYASSSQVSMSSPHVRTLGPLCAIVSYTRLIQWQKTDDKGRVKVGTTVYEETRVWKREGESAPWLMVHMHRSRPGGAAAGASS